MHYIHDMKLKTGDWFLVTRPTLIIFSEVNFYRLHDTCLLVSDKKVSSWPFCFQRLGPGNWECSLIRPIPFVPLSQVFVFCLCRDWPDASPVERLRETMVKFGLLGASERESTPEQLQLEQLFKKRTTTLKGVNCFSVIHFYL